MNKTPIQELIDYLDKDVELRFLKQKDIERIKWYIETYFLQKEKQFGLVCFEAGEEFAKIIGTTYEEGELHFDEFYKQYE